MRKVSLTLTTLLLGVVAFLSSCGGPKAQEKDLEIQNAEVLGDSADIVSVVDGTYKLVGTVPTDITEVVSIKIKLRLEKPVSQKDIDVTGWNVSLLDKNGTVLSDDLTMKSDEYSKLEKFLTTGKAGDEEEFSFSYSYANGKLYNDIMDKTVMISLSGVSYSLPQTYDTSSSTESSVDEASNSDDLESSEVSSSNADEFLDAYSEYVDKYISYMQKVSEGDMSAISEYPALLKKAQEFDEKISHAQGEMTSEQWSRFLEIQQRMIQTMQESSNQ